MCGIAGMIGPQPPDSARIRRTLAALGHRGPDGQCSLVTRLANGQTVVQLHTRLAIRDLDPRAGQPFAHDGCVLVHNGEVYNDRMNEVTAAVGLAQLAKLDRVQAARAANFAALRDALAPIDGVTVFQPVQGRALSSHYCLNAVLPRDGRHHRGRGGHGEGEELRERTGEQARPPRTAGRRPPRTLCERSPHIGRRRGSWLRTGTGRSFRSAGRRNERSGSAMSRRRRRRGGRRAVPTSRRA
ncbi:MAG: hypothetical protein FJX36_05895 [Alphaproteobacteria bacterium]|nr:hypothetical protein [Alphaproteobacteria bacterium]